MATMTLTQIPENQTTSDKALGSISWLTKAIKTIQIWRQREISRAQTARTSLRTLQDAGIDSAQIFIERNKPFWEV